MQHISFDVPKTKNSIAKKIMHNPNRILVSEDTAAWQGIFKAVVPGDYKLVPATTLQETLQKLDKFFFNAAIVDLALDPTNESRLDGVETMKRIARDGEGTQAIVLTGKGSVDLAVQSLRDYRVFHFLEKEKFDEKAFLEILAEASIQGYRFAQGPGHMSAVEPLFDSVDRQRCASILGVSRADLETMVNALVREAMPIRFKTARLALRLDPAEHSLTCDFWSKWFGEGLRVSAGRKGTIKEPARILESRQLEKLVGFLSPSEQDFDAYRSS